MAKIKYLIAQVTPEYHHKVRKDAADMNITMAELVRRAVREFLERAERDGPESVPEEDAHG